MYNGKVYAYKCICARYISQHQKTVSVLWAFHGPISYFSSQIRKRSVISPFVLEYQILNIIITGSTQGQ